MFLLVGSFMNGKPSSLWVGTAKLSINQPCSWQVLAQAIRNKAVLSKFCDSVLTKSAKIRGLVADLQKHYEDPMATKSMS